MRSPLAPLFSNPPSPFASPRKAPALLAAPAALEDEFALFCHEDLPTPEDLRRLAWDAEARADAEACWCLAQCPGPCRNARPVRPCPPPLDDAARARLKRKRHDRADADADAAAAASKHHSRWPQRFDLWHASDFSKTAVEMDCTLAFRDVFHELCCDERVPRAAVQFVWARRCASGAVQLVVLRDTDTPRDVGMRDGVPQTVEAEFI